MNIGVIGLVAAGGDLAIDLQRAGYEILAFDDDAAVRSQISHHGIKTSSYIDELAFGLESKRVIWIFQPNEEKMNDVLELLVPHLSVSDILIVLNPSIVETTVQWCREVQGFQIDLLDCSLMDYPDGKRKALVGGNKFAFNYCEKMIRKIADVVYCGLCGTGIQRKLSGSTET